VTIEFKTRKFPDHLRVECTGSFSQDSTLSVFERGFALAADGDHEALLIDTRNVTGREPTLAERYELAVRVAELQATQTPRIRMAMLGHEPMIHPERFGEIVATNRGALARVFTDERAALAWLLAPPKTR
jgi:hypothetical protein